MKPRLKPWYSISPSAYRLPFQGWTSSRFGIRCSQPRQAAWAYLLLTVSNLRRIAFDDGYPSNVGQRRSTWCMPGSQAGCPAAEGTVQSSVFEAAPETTDTLNFGHRTLNTPRPNCEQFLVICSTDNRQQTPLPNPPHSESPGISPG